jgi:hypothetical protein
MGILAIQITYVPVFRVMSLYRHPENGDAKIVLFLKTGTLTSKSFLKTGMLKMAGTLKTRMSSTDADYSQVFHSSLWKNLP